MRALVIACVMALCGVATATGAAPVRAALTTTSPRPVADTPWRYTITVKDQKGKPALAKARLQILLGTLVVGCWRSTAMVPCEGASSGTWTRFKGKRTGVLAWPAQSVGVKLTFVATVVAGGRTFRLRAPVVVQLS